MAPHNTGEAMINTIKHQVKQSVPSTLSIIAVIAVFLAVQGQGTIGRWQEARLVYNASLSQIEVAIPETALTAKAPKVAKVVKLQHKPRIPDWFIKKYS